MTYWIIEVSGDLMRLHRFVAAASGVALVLAIGSTDANAFTTSIGMSTGKTTAYVSPGQNNKNSPYAQALQREILAEIRRTHLPFVIASPFFFIVRFDLDRRGKLLGVKLLQGSNSAAANEYAILIIRRAAHNFLPPPADLAGERLSFVQPLLMRNY